MVSGYAVLAQERKYVSEESEGLAEEDSDGSEDGNECGGCAWNDDDPQRYY